MTTRNYKLPQGQIRIIKSDQSQSKGELHLFPLQELDKHNRPVAEQLQQIKGTCVMKLFNDNKFIKDVKLQEGQKLTIPPNQYHIHSNQTNAASITAWKFRGNITKIIKQIRKSYSKAE